MNIPMSLLDFVPVVLFLMASMTLLHDMYHLMSKGAFALFAAGMITISAAGFYKAIWKLLYTMNICDFAALNNTFFPMQSTGFLLAAIGMIGLLKFPQKERTLVFAPPLYTSSMLFVIFNVLGTACIWGGLAVIAGRMKKRNASFMFAVSFVCMLAMGYLSSRDFTIPLMNWIGEVVNVTGMALLLAGVRIMHEAGLEDAEI